jgi:transposase
LESAGSYSKALARYLQQAEYVASLVNPARIKAFVQSRLVRAKQNKLDA